MKRQPIPEQPWINAPSDGQLIGSWDRGFNTADIAKHFSYPEYCVDSRLWRLREERRAS